MMLSPLYKALSRALFFYAIFSASTPLNAADAKGQFAIRGAGLINCALYTRERALQEDVYLMAAAWSDGYITGINQYAPDTYDLLSFESTELLMNIVDRHCANHPADPIFGVLSSLFEKLQQDRITQKSDKSSFKQEQRSGQLYAETISRIQHQLKQQGFYQGKIDQQTSEQTQEALKAFQASIGFKASGFPDQMTLWRLLRNDN